MLSELSIRNLAVIESLQVQFGTGFHVLSGETGAGKSIVIDALSLVAGGRSSADLVRYGCDKAEIEALFDLPKEHPLWMVLEGLGIAAEREDPVLIRREVTSSGKSTSRVNGQLVNLSMLKEIGEHLINIHGQHEHQSLLKSEFHLEWLDAFGGSTVAKAKAKYQEEYKHYTALVKEYEEVQKANRNGLQLSDMYRFQLQEIEAASLRQGEDELLAEEKRKLANAEKLYSGVADAYESLYGNKQGLESVGKALQKLQAAVAYDQAALKPILDQVQSAYYQLEDAVHELRAYRDQIEFNPVRLDEIESRLASLTGLKRKYGATVEDILVYAEKIGTELDYIDRKDEKLEQLSAALEKQRAVLMHLGERLSEVRKQSALKLASQIETHLSDLHMEKTRFQVQIEPLPQGTFVKTGIDQAEFMISPNPGEPLKPIGKIASGGELSRVMLAMKSIFAAIDQIPVLVFDEVDTGVSGRAAQAIAEKMSRLSEYSQVFSITHLPQVACMADRQYLIRKHTENERTYTTVQLLENEQRAEELARMLGGVEITETTLTHAKEMLVLAENMKNH
ncbi:DNA repair protein RecN [Paenibacillus turpanensis]|uniref:DNA repair protein RecN n=1 Tax=Paenibacillus turpanensis TaxID=2689078 RepID=UPI00140B06C3|nr:DNA repair protein RecN [Paenibacillus turpanensis]